MKLKSTPMLMGILNVTPDSYYDGGRHLSLNDAIRRCNSMIEEGADIIDLGGESTRPGAAPITVEQEMARLVPVLTAIKKNFQIPVSIDTRHPKTMQACLELGADMINDVQALQAEGALAAVAQYDPFVCLMHMQNQPTTMQLKPNYENVVTEVMLFLKARKEVALQAGISQDKIILDPGIGFGKKLTHNLELIKMLEQFLQLDSPILIGVSRKSMFGDLLGLKVEDRLAATLGATAIAVWHGAKIIRTHDVKATKECVETVIAIKSNQGR